MTLRLNYFFMKKTLSLFFWLLLVKICCAQNVGIGTTNPQAKLDINGDIAFLSADITITTTYNYALDVNTVKQSNYKLRGSLLRPNARMGDQVNAL